MDFIMLLHVQRSRALRYLKKNWRPFEKQLLSTGLTKVVLRTYSLISNLQLVASKLVADKAEE